MGDAGAPGARLAYGRCAPAERRCDRSSWGARYLQSANGTVTMSSMTADRVECLCREHRGVLVRSLHRLGIDAATAEDAAQEALFRLCQQVEEPTNVGGWLYIVARRVAASMYRWSHARREESGHPVMLARFPDPALSALEEVLYRERLGWVVGVLGKLRPRDREVLVRWSRAPRYAKKGLAFTAAETEAIRKAKRRLQAAAVA